MPRTVHVNLEGLENYIPLILVEQHAGHGEVSASELVKGKGQ